MYEWSSMIPKISRCDSIAMALKNDDDLLSTYMAGHVWAET